LSIASDWHDRHGPVRRKGRLLVYVILLALTLLFMTRAGSIARTFSVLFGTDADSTSGSREPAE